MNNKFTVIESTDEDKLQEMDRINKIAKLKLERECLLNSRE